jgi:hypothetical protein
VPRKVEVHSWDERVEDVCFALCWSDVDLRRFLGDEPGNRMMQLEHVLRQAGISRHNPLHPTCSPSPETPAQKITVFNAKQALAKSQELKAQRRAGQEGSGKIRRIPAGSLPASEGEHVH